MAPAQIIQMTSSPPPTVKKTPRKQHHHHHHVVKQKPDVEAMTRDMVASLSSQEREIAARTSYSYFVASENSTSSSENTDEIADHHARAMARRHLIGEKLHVHKATKQLKKTIQYRQDYKVNGEIRQAFATENKVGTGILHQLQDGELFIRGYDKDQRAIFHVMPRNANKAKYSDAVGYVNSYVYLMERALACTERASNGKEETVNVMVDFLDYDKDKAPPIRMVKELLFILKDHYPERLHKVYLIDAPGIFRAFWTLLKPFIDPVTKQKFQFVTGQAQKQAAFEVVLEEDQAMPYLLPNGKLTNPVDMERFLLETPFDHAMDEN